MKRYTLYVIALSIFGFSVSYCADPANRRAAKRNIRAAVQAQRNQKPSTPPVMVMPSCEQQTYYYKQQAHQYYYYANGYSQQVKQLLNALNVKSATEASQKIEQLQQRKTAQANTPPPLPPRPGKMFVSADLQKLLSMMGAETVKDAIEMVQTYENYVVRSFTAVFQTSANALNSQKVNQLIANIKQSDPQGFALPDNINALNQAIVRAIYQLKADYLDATSTLQWAQPNIALLHRIIAAKKQGLNSQQLLQMIPSQELTPQSSSQTSQTEKLKALEALSFE